jgi:hypothetical protein
VTEIIELFGMKWRYVTESLSLLAVIVRVSRTGDQQGVACQHGKVDRAVERLGRRWRRRRCVDAIVKRVGVGVAATESRWPTSVPAVKVPFSAPANASPFGKAIRPDVRVSL